MVHEGTVSFVHRMRGLFYFKGHCRRIRPFADLRRRPGLTLLAHRRELVPDLVQDEPRRRPLVLGAFPQLHQTHHAHAQHQRQHQHPQHRPQPHGGAQGTQEPPGIDLGASPLHQDAVVVDHDGLGELGHLGAGLRQAEGAQGEVHLLRE